MMDNDALQCEIADFVRLLESEHRLATNTIRAYQRDLAALETMAREYGVTRWSALSHKQAKRFAARLHQRGLSATSIQRMLCGCRRFFNYLIKIKAAGLNPFIGVAAPRRGRRLPNTLSVDEMNALFVGDPDNPADIRDRAILELFYSSGMRLAELAALDLSAPDMEQNQIVVTGKGNRQRIVTIGRMAREALVNWLPVRERLAAKDEPALFVNQRGHRISPRGIQYRIKQWAAKKGLGRHLHPHMLRHSFASHILESSGDLRAVQEMLGHRDVSSTQIYTHLDFQHLAKVHDKAHPRSRG